MQLFMKTDIIGCSHIVDSISDIELSTLLEEYKEFISSNNNLETTGNRHRFYCVRKTSGEYDAYGKYQSTILEL